MLFMFYLHNPTRYYFNLTLRKPRRVICQGQSERTESWPHVWLEPPESMWFTHSTLFTVLGPQGNGKQGKLGLYLGSAQTFCMVPWMKACPFSSGCCKWILLQEHTRIPLLSAFTRIAVSVLMSLIPSSLAPHLGPEYPLRLPLLEEPTGRVSLPVWYLPFISTSTQSWFPAHLILRRDWASHSKYQLTYLLNKGFGLDYL